MCCLRATRKCQRVIPLFRMSQDGDTSACVLVTIDKTLINVRGNNNRTTMYIANYLLQQGLTNISSKQSDYSNSNFKQKTLNSVCRWTKFYIGVPKIIRVFSERFLNI